MTRNLNLLIVVLTLSFLVNALTNHQLQSQQQVHLSQLSQKVSAGFLKQTLVQLMDDDEESTDDTTTDSEDESTSTDEEVEVTSDDSDKDTTTDESEVEEIETDSEEDTSADSEDTTTATDDETEVSTDDTTDESESDSEDTDTDVLATDVVLEAFDLSPEYEITDDDKIVTSAWLTTYDSDGDSYLGSEEFETGMADLGYNSYYADMCFEMVDGLDGAQYKDDLLMINELNLLYEISMSSTSMQSLFAFRAFDSDTDGYLQTTDWESVESALGDVYDTTWDNVDTDGDG